MIIQWKIIGKALKRLLSIVSKLLNSILALFILFIFFFIFSYLFPNKYLCMGISFIYVYLLYRSYCLLKINQGKEISLKKISGIIILSVLLITIIFGNVYYTIFSYSMHINHNFRINEQSNVGRTIACFYANKYLDYRLKYFSNIYYNSMQNLGDSIIVMSVRNQARFNNMFDLSPPSTELDDKRVDYEKIGDLSYKLAIEHESFIKHYDGNVEGFFPFISCIDAAPYSMDSTKNTSLFHDKNNVYQLFTDEYIKEFITKSICLKDIYSSFLLYSAMLFMTVGYADISPNSNLVLLIMFIQFVVYITAFLIVLPLLINRHDKQN